MSILQKGLKTFGKSMFSLHNEKLRSHDNLLFFQNVSIIFIYLIKKCIKLIFISNKDNKKQLICLGDVIIKELSSTFKLSIEFLREIFKKYNFNISEIN